MKPNILTSLSVEQLKRALEIREQIEKLEIELSSILGEAPAAPVKAPVAIASAPAVSAPVAKGRKGKRIMSDEWKAKIAAAQHRRWAKTRAEKAASLTPTKPLVQPVAKKIDGRKKVMSPETKAKIAAALKASHAAKAKASRDY